MKLRLWSTFSVIGIVLIGLGLFGLVNHHFVFDPGQTPDVKEPWYYIFLGVLMIVNGVFTPPAPADDKQDDDAASKSVKSSAAT